MSIETRSSSALFKRAEQLRRWEESDTNREPVSPKQKSRKIKFSSGCVFLAACAAGEKEEVQNLLDKGADIDTANVDGLTALHQACIDDNLDMVEFLVQNKADVNRGDNEGWTPLHATASCGFLSIAKYLIEHGANVAAVNCDGELAVDIAESEAMEDLLKSEVEQQGIDCEKARSEEERMMMRDANEWLSSKSSQVNVGNSKTGATALHVAAAKGYTDVMKILLQCGSDVNKQDVDGWTPLHAAAHWGQKEAAELLINNYADMDAQNFVGQTPSDVSDNDMVRYLDFLKKRQIKEDFFRQPKKRQEVQDRPAEAETPTKVKRVEVKIEENEKTEKINEAETVEKKNRVNALNNSEPVHITPKEPEAPIKGPPVIPPKLLQTDTVNSDDNTPSWRRPTGRTNSHSFRDKDVSNENDVTLRRINSFQNDPDNSTSKLDSLESTNVTTSSTTTTSTTNNTATTTTTTTSPTKTTTTSPTTSPLPNSVPVRRSFVPPVRDEESETQRKAHAKRVRETRRSTQGVTLEEIKSAEQLVKKKNQSVNNNNNNTTEQPGANGDTSNVAVSVTATITTAAPTVITRDTEEPVTTHERRPSWRLRVDNGSKFKLEDATKAEEPPSTPSFVRRTGLQANTTPRPSSAPVETADTTVTLPLRRPKSLEEKEQDKENDARNAQATLATQAAIQRRRRPKRRSTGVVAFDNVDDAESEKDSSGGGGGDYEDSSKMNHQESGNDRSSRSSRVSSTNDLILRGENGEIDYKKLYEQTLTENDRLKDKLRKSEEELRDTKSTLEKLTTVTSKNSLSELEKRERRAMERKLSEMEEELKQLEMLKNENQRLKDENGALIRVISKLSK